MILLIGCSPPIAAALVASAWLVRNRVALLASSPAVELVRAAPLLDGWALVAGLPAMGDERRLIEMRVSACGFAGARVACVAASAVERPGMWTPATALSRLTACATARDTEAPLPLRADVDIGCLTLMDNLLHGLKNATLKQVISARLGKRAAPTTLAESATRFELLDVLARHPGAGQLATTLPALRRGIEEARSLAKQDDWRAAIARLLETVDHIDAYWRHCREQRSWVASIERNDGTILAKGVPR